MKSDWLEAAASVVVLAGLAGGSILAIEYFVDLPPLLLAAGWLLFLGSVVSAFPLAVLDARRQGVTVPRALGQGMWRGLKYLFYLLP